MIHLPKQFSERMKEFLQEEYSQYIESFENEYGQTLRVNRLKAEPADLIRRFLLTEKDGIFEPVPWCPDGYYYDGPVRLSIHPWYYGGLYYLQEPSAMAPAAFLPVKAGDRVLDLCAAPGGKSTALAGKLQGQGLLVSNDISASRAKALLKNMELAGVANMLITCEKPEKLATYFPGYFDGVLVDAPCSGEGMFRKDPSMMKSWSMEEVENYSSIQKDILTQACRMVRPGGYVLYSTCTYSPEEDEEVVAQILIDQPEMKLVPVEEGFWETHNAPSCGQPEWISENLSDQLGPDKNNLSFCRRFWSHRVQGEGQFAALLKKEGGDEPEKEVDQTFQTVFQEQGPEGRKDKGKDKKTDKRTNKKKDKIKKKGRIKETVPAKDYAAEFLEECDFTRLYDKGFRRITIGDQIFQVGEGFPDTAGLRVVRSGLLLGELKKNRFEPSQALAMALRPEEYPRVWKLTAADPEVSRYLKGETIPCPCEQGYVLVCVDGYPLGWGKCAGGRLKNKYKPGWRQV